MNTVENLLVRDHLVASIIYHAKIQDSEITFLRKRDSKLLSFVGLFAKHMNPNWETSLITLNKSIYLPDWFVESLEHPVHRAAGVAHEVTHVLDKNKIGFFRFILGYSYPQNLALGALLMLLCTVSLWFLGAVGFLVALYKWAAPFRANWELRGYTATLAVKFWATGVYDSEEAQHAVESLSGSPYWYCCPEAKRELAKIKEQILQTRFDDDSVLNTEFLQNVKKIFVLPK